MFHKLALPIPTIAAALCLMLVAAPSAWPTAAASPSSSGPAAYSPTSSSWRRTAQDASRSVSL